MNSLDLQLVEYEKISSKWEVASPFPAPVSGLNTQTIGAGSHIDQEQLFARYDDVNNTYGILQGSSGRQYEYFVLNPDKMDNGLIWLPSTSFSGALKNPGNVQEACLSATLNDGLAYVYVTSFGNFPTGSMTNEDMRYLAKTGRLTKGNGKDIDYSPLPSVEDMAETFSDKGFTPSHISANEEAGRLGLALMSAFKKDTTKQVFLDGLDGISPYANYLAAPFVADMKSRVYRRKKGASGEHGPGELTPPEIKELKNRIPAIYKGARRYAHLAPLPAVLFPQDVFAKGMLARGFRGHNNLEDLANHALFQDFMAGWQNQSAQIDLHFNLKSSLHDVEDAISFGGLILNNMPEGTLDSDRKLKIYIGQGNITHHTDFPQDRVALERLSFREYLRELSLLNGVGGIALTATSQYLGGQGSTRQDAAKAPSC